MLNLLNIVAFMFFGVTTVGASTTELNIAYDFNVVENDTEGSNALFYTFELTPIINLYSGVFEPDTYLNGELLAPFLIEYEIADALLSDVDYITYSMQYYNPFIRALVQPYSSINVSFIYYCEFTVHFNDGSYFYDEFEDEYNYTLNTNFTIYNTFAIFNDTNTFSFQFEFYNDLGYDVGYDDGFEVGFDDGYDVGYSDGQLDFTNVFNGDWVGWLGSAVTGFFALEIFPNFTLGGVIGAIICVWIWLWILKVFAGG